MFRLFYTWGAGYVPKVGVRFIHSSTRSPIFQALVDSGAAITIANRAIAQTLGLTDDDSIGDPIQITVAGGRRITVHRFELDIEVGVPSDQPLSLSRSTVCFSEEPLPFPVLLGQRDFME